MPLAVCDAPTQSGCCQYRPRSSPAGVLTVNVRTRCTRGPFLSAAHGGLSPSVTLGFTVSKMYFLNHFK